MAEFSGGYGGLIVIEHTIIGQITTPRGCCISISRPSPPSPTRAGACYSPRPGTAFEHPLGRAWDGTFGNAIGQYPIPAQLELGWQVTNWMKQRAEILARP